MCALTLDRNPSHVIRVYCAFAQNGSLKVHFAIIKLFKCDLCGLCVAQNGSLKVHFRTHTG